MYPTGFRQQLVFILNFIEGKKTGKTIRNNSDFRKEFEVADGNPVWSKFPVLDCENI